MQELSEFDPNNIPFDNRFYIHHWNNASKVILGLGSNTQREYGLKELHRLAD